MLKVLTLPRCNTTFYLSAYADDVIVFFINDNDDVQELQHDFKNISSALVNWRKSGALLIGNWEG